MQMFRHEFNLNFSGYKPLNYIETESFCGYNPKNYFTMPAFYFGKVINLRLRMIFFYFCTIMYSQQDILEFISNNRDLLREKFHVTRIGIFGSYARKEQTIQSDIDIIVDFEVNTQNLFELKLQLKQFFKDEFNIDVDICRERYIKPRFRKRIENEAIYVE